METMHLSCTISKIRLVNCWKSLILGEPFIKRFALCYRTIVLSVSLSVLSVCLSAKLVYCGQTVGWIKMKLVIGVGLGPDQNVLDGDPTPLLQKGHSPQFWPMSVVAKRLDGSRCHLVWWSALARQHCVRWGPSSSSPKQGARHPPIFGWCLLWPNGEMDQDATWYGGKPRPRPHCVRWGPSPSPQWGTAPNFRPNGYMEMPLPTEVGLGPGDIVLDGDPAPPKRGHMSPPLFGQCLL